MKKFILAGIFVLFASVAVAAPAGYQCTETGCYPVSGRVTVKSKTVQTVKHNRALNNANCPCENCTCENCVCGVQSSCDNGVCSTSYGSTRSYSRQSVKSGVRQTKFRSRSRSCCR